MVDHFSFKRQSDANPQLLPTVQSSSSSELSDKAEIHRGLSEKAIADLAAAEQSAGFFARPWTRREKLFYGSLGFLTVILAALVVALPIVFTKPHNDHDGDDWVPYRSKHPSPSYSVEKNKPIWALWDFPDPGLIEHNGTWYAFGTNPRKNNPATIHVPVATSSNFVNWTLLKHYDAMPTVGGWERKINHWAPDVIQRHDGKFVLYYAGETKDYGRHHCIGAAVSERNDPVGPYIPLKEPLACPHRYGGAIDPSPFRDVDGKLYVVYKGDGNSVGSGGYCGNTRLPRKPVPLLLHELEQDGVTLIGEPTILLNIIKSDGPLIEAPNIIRSQDGTYYLFFSSHCFTSLGYNVKYAHAQSIKGPYTRVPRPLLQTGDFELRAPGGATVSNDGTKIVFHANCGRWRCMYASAIDTLANNHTIVMSHLQPQSPGAAAAAGGSTTDTSSS